MVALVVICYEIGKTDFRTPSPSLEASFESFAGFATAGIAFFVHVFVLMANVHNSLDFFTVCEANP